MKKVNAVELRQSLGKVVAELEAGGEPILLARGKRVVAALISLKDFEERFVARAASEARRKILEEMDEMARPSSVAVDSARLLRELRDHG
ncbi:MAG: type II toxin-antitoxin system Phd/YefM family antitoxin [Deltaproteobacteria bacterium]|nr:type II toxin-antitoxin system Phd/YefM family antitoxin [Deltaproteobacteria bacterium]